MTLGGPSLLSSSLVCMDLLQHVVSWSIASNFYKAGIISGGPLVTLQSMIINSLPFNATQIIHGDLHIIFRFIIVKLSQELSTPEGTLATLSYSSTSFHYSWLRNLPSKCDLKVFCLYQWNLVHNPYGILQLLLLYIVLSFFIYMTLHQIRSSHQEQQSTQSWAIGFRVRQ